MPTEQTQTLTLERLFDCTLYEMWSAWSDPEQYARWFNPFPGKDAIIEKWEFKEGGKISFFMVDNDGNRLPNSGRFTRIDPPHEIETEEGQMRLRVRFEAAGDKTKLILEQTGLAHGIPLSDVREGWGAILNKLDAVLTLRSTRVDDRAVVHTRLLDAPRELVFRAFTEREHVAEWWGPAGFRRNTIHAMDVRKGGQWRFTMHGPDGKDYENVITYTEVRPPARLAYHHGSPEAPQMFSGSVDLEEVEGKTRLTFKTMFPTREALEAVIRDVDAVNGGNQTLDKLEAHIEKMQA